MNMRLSPNSDDPKAQHNVPSIRCSKREQRVPAVPPVLCQAMRTPEQLPALEETKAQDAISRTCRATVSNTSPGTVVLQDFCITLQLENWSTKGSNLSKHRLLPS